MSKSVSDIVRKAEQSYVFSKSHPGRYVYWSMYETIERIFAYLNSTHTSGSTDSLGREKPFFNIVTAACNIWYRATDIGKKDMQILPDKAQNTALAFIANVLLQEWMKEEHFEVFLNSWGRTLAQYGSAMTKWVTKGGKLVPSIVPWNRLIVDQVDIEALPIIEKIYKTEEQLLTSGYDQKAVENLCHAHQTRRNIDRTSKDQVLNEFIELYEVHGEMSAEVYKKAKGQKVLKGDDKIFFPQMHVISYIKNAKDDKFDDFTLYVGREARSPYLLTHLIQEEGRTLSIGAVEYLFDAQWMANHTMKAWKDQLDLASKLIFQTADKRYADKNVLTQIETGDILFHDPNAPLTEVPNAGHDTSSLKVFQDEWKAMAQEITSTPEALRGVTAPSGQSFALGSLQAQQGQSLFLVMTRNKEIFCEAFLREFIIPHLKTKMDTTDEISAILESHNIQQLEGIYVPREAVRQYNKKAKQAILNGQIPDQFNQQGEEAIIKQQFNPQGNQRFFIPSEDKNITWKEILKDFEWKVAVSVETTKADKQAILGTLNTVFQTIASNPHILSLPTAKMVFDKILALTDTVSPIELAQTNIPFRPTLRMNERLDFKDLANWPEAQQQMLGLAGIDVSLPPQAQPNQQSQETATPGVGGQQLPANIQQQH